MFLIKSSSTLTPFPGNQFTRKSISSVMLSWLLMLLLSACSGSNKPLGLTAFSPASGMVGSSVTLTGSNLDTVTEVKFGETKAEVFSLDATNKIIVTVPTGAQSSAISVSNKSGSAAFSEMFTVVIVIGSEDNQDTNTGGTDENSSETTPDDAIPEETTPDDVPTVDDIHTTNISAVMHTLKQHISGESTLTESQIVEQVSFFSQNTAYLNTNETVIKEVFDLVDYYESTHGALFVNDQTKKGFNRAALEGDGFALARAIFSIQQAIHDNLYTPDTIAAYQSLLSGRQFKTAAYFPGSATPPTNADTTEEVSINGSIPAYWGKPVSYSSDPARRPTGLYLAPGSFGKVKVPSNMVNQGFSVLVGAHTWDKTTKTLINRFDRVTTSFPIVSEVTTIANPFGGGIYIVVPYLADLGNVKIQVSNAIKAPYFSLTSLHKMTLEEWQVKRSNPAPWADFETDKFMMQVPTKWIYAFADPLTLLQNWDKAMDGMSEFIGYPTERNRTVLYLQVDVSLAHSAYGIGYPMVNDLYDPFKVETGNKNHTLLTNPMGWAVLYHELGHAHLFSRFSGETEAIVNFPYVYISNVKFGNDINSAFKSSGYSPYMSRDQAAIDWMVTENFRNDNPMDRSNTTKDEFRYQSRGYAKYMDIALLFGWNALTDFYTQENLDYMNGTPSDGLSADDSRILRLSIAAGVDLTPLFYFWGIHPQNIETLKAKITAAGLPKSEEIYALLSYYKSIAPKNNADFKAHQLSLYPTLPTGGNPDYGYGWYNVWTDVFNDSYGEAIQAQIQTIIDSY